MPDLLSHIERLPTERVLIHQGTQKLCAGDLLWRARQLRQEHTALAGESVVLRLSQTLDLIHALLALEGSSRQLLLLPLTIPPEEATTLIERSDCHWCLDDAGAHPLSVTATTGGPCAATSWLLATSGTTGTPKLIQHSLATLTRSVRHDSTRGADFIWGLLYDPCRFAGLQVLLQALIGGSCLVLPDRFDFESQIRALLDGRVNALSATPSFWRKLLMDGRLGQLRLRQITLGGEITDQPLLDHLQQLFPEARIRHIYASTEAGVGFAVTDGLAGFPLAWVNAPELSVSLRIGIDGHLWVRPPLHAGGEEVLSRLDHEGFFDTGDQVEVLGQRVRFLGRAGGIINVGGNKVHPEEIEGLIRQVSGVLEVRVRAKASPFTGALVMAEVQAHPDIEHTALRVAILQHCRERCPAYKVPATIHFVDALSVTPTGKLARDQEAP